MTSIYDLKKKCNTTDLIKKCTKEYSNLTNRNTILMYSGWLTNNTTINAIIDDLDKTSLIDMCSDLNPDKGLNLILHTPGGEIGATESIIDYLNAEFKGNIKAIIPQIAMSGGTMLACSCKEIVMGKQSNLGPVDPQIAGLAVHDIVNEFEKIMKDAETSPPKLNAWNTIVQPLPLSYLESCYNTIEWSNDILRTSLKNNMFKDDIDEEKINNIVVSLASPKDTKNHARHLSPKKCRELGLNITSMEDNMEEYNLIMTIHSLCMIFFEENNSSKIFVNQNGKFMSYTNP